ncbi:Sin-like protein conserved region-domain-containing protein [Obelidium mucronatum]|nr:Sin-like protein conserved region-domain-containing protein [Obelidium mucronatum]
MSDVDMADADAAAEHRADADADDDAVVQEIPVFLSTQLLAAHGLVLVQHPATKRTQPLASAAAMRCKPVARRFEVDVALETKGANYSDDQAEKLGRGVDNEDILTAYDIKKNNPYREDQHKMLEKITLQSTLLPDSGGGQYLIGALRDDEFHLTPISATIQLRPALRYIDKIAEKEKVATQKIAQHEMNLENPNRKEEEPQEKGITLSVRSVEDNPEALRKAREIDEEKRFALEEWVDLQLYEDHTPESQEAYEKLFSLGDELTYSFSKQDYLENIGPKLSSSVKLEIDQGKKNVKPNWCMDDMRNLPLPSLLRSLMLHAHVVSFSNIMELTDNQFEESDVVEELERIAVLVRGVWVVRTELMYAGRTADARRYLLQLLGRSSKPVSRYDVNRLAKLPHLVITNMFLEICARVAVVTEANSGHHVGGGKVLPGTESASKWGLKVEPDEEFCERWEQVVTRQRETVEAEGNRARSALENKVSSKTLAPVQPSQRDSHATSTHGSSSSRAPKKEPAPAASTASASAASSSSAAPRSKQSASRAAPAATAAVVDTFAISGATAEAQCENILYFALNKHGVCSQDYLRGIVERHKTVQPTEGDNLLDSEEVNDEFVKDVIRDLCMNIQGRYVLKSLGGGAVDEFRDPILELFKAKTTLKKSEITAACQTATGKNITQSMYARIMKELATSSGPAWELKQGPSI